MVFETSSLTFPDLVVCVAEPCSGGLHKDIIVARGWHRYFLELILLLELFPDVVRKEALNS
jgi:hypothetical protein